MDAAAAAAKLDDHRYAGSNVQVVVGSAAELSYPDDAGVHVHADDLEPAGGQRHSGRPPDVAQPDDGGAR